MDGANFDQSNAGIDELGRVDYQRLCSGQLFVIYMSKVYRIDCLN